MILVLADALPPLPLAAELARRLPTAAPTLATWMGSAPARVAAVPAVEAGCTPLEAWRLEQAGYRPPPDVPLGAGAAVLALGEPATLPADEPVWLADLVHLHVAQQGVTLTDPAALALREDECLALLEAAAPEFAAESVAAEPLGPQRLRLRLPAGITPYAPTPAAASGNEVHTWWPQQPSARPWRRLVNAVQMVWHEHPVNLARAEAGQLPVNGLWLFGGGRPADFAPAAATDEPLIDTTLGPAAARGDWAAWLEALATLERERLAPLAARGTPPTELVLTGAERLARLTPATRRGLARWLPRRPLDWTTWWTA